MGYVVFERHLAAVTSKALAPACSSNRDHSASLIVRTGPVTSIQDLGLADCQYCACGLYLYDKEERLSLYYFFFVEKYFAALGLRCGHPGQQQGRRLPLSKSACSRSMCSFLVSAFLTMVTQQIHSLRESGVSPSHRVASFGVAETAILISRGVVCKKVEDFKAFAMYIFYHLTSSEVVIS